MIRAPRNRTGTRKDVSSKDMHLIHLTTRQRLTEVEAENEIRAQKLDTDNPDSNIEPAPKCWIILNPQTIRTETGGT